MHYFIIASVIIFWVPCVLFVLGAITCALSSRLFKKADIKLFKSKENSIVASNNNREVKTVKNKTIKLYLYGLCRYYSILIGKIPSNRIRKALLRIIFSMKISKKAVINGGFELRSPWNIKIGDSIIGANSLLDGRYCIEIGNNVTLSQNVCIFTVQHDVNDPYFSVGNKSGKVIIKDYAWISSNTTILPSVVVGEGAVLASSAVATKNLEPYFIYVGIPAIKKSSRNKNLLYKHDKKNQWHFY